jgi:hypothetical protein
MMLRASTLAALSAVANCQEWVRFARIVGDSGVAVGRADVNNWDYAGADTTATTSCSEPNIPGSEVDDSTIDMNGVQFCALRIIDMTNTLTEDFTTAAQPSTWDNSHNQIAFDLENGGHALFSLLDAPNWGNGCMEPMATYQACFNPTARCKRIANDYWGCCDSTYGTQDQGGFTYNTGFFLEWFATE